MYQCSQEVRNKLNEIVSPKNKSWWTPELFEKNVRNILPKEIEVLEPPLGEKDQYNCFIFVLGLEKDRRFIGKHDSNDSPFYQLSFFPKLIQAGHLETATTPVAGNLILYENDKRVVTHAGKIESPDIVVSKWSWGPLIKHHIWCVPKHYGDKISFYKKPEDSTLSRIIEFGNSLIRPTPIKSLSGK